MLVHRNRERKPPVISPHHLLKEAFDRSYIPVCREHELYRVSIFIQCTIEIFPLLPDFKIGLIKAVRSASQLQVWAHPPVDLRGITLDPSEDRGMVY